MKNIKYILVGFLLFFLIASPLASFAQSQDQLLNPFEGTNIESKVTNYTQIQTIIKNIINWLYTIFFVVAVFFILLAAYNYLLGGQDEKHIATAKSQLRYAVIAIVIALIASGIAIVINTFIGAASS